MASGIQTEFDFKTAGLFGHQRTVVRIDEAAKALAISERHVRELVDAGELTAIFVNTAVDCERKHLRIVRASVEEFAARRVVV